MTQNINNTGAVIKEQIILGNIDDLNIDDLFNNTNNKKMNTQNYPTWLVPLDIAQQLKEIGFDEPTLFHYYEHDFDITIETNSYYDEGEAQGYLHFYISAFKEENFNRDKKCISLPTFEQVFAWFRACGLYSYIRSCIATENFYIYSIYDNNNFDKCCGRRDTYEAAQKECVKALIQTYKQEQLK